MVHDGAGAPIKLAVIRAKSPERSRVLRQRWDVVRARQTRKDAADNRKAGTGTVSGALPGN